MRSSLTVHGNRRLGSKETYLFRMLLSGHAHGFAKLLILSLICLQLQLLRDSGQANDPRFKSLVAFLQAQQAAGNSQGVGSIGGSTGGGPPGSLSPSIQLISQQDGNPRSTGDSQITSLGNSDTNRGAQAHSQAAYLQHALLSAQQKAQVNAYSQQKVSKLLQTGATRDFNSANNLNLQVRSCTTFP